MPNSRTRRSIKAIRLQKRMLGTRPFRAAVFFVCVLMFIWQGCSHGDDTASQVERPRLNVYNWTNYIARLTVSEFSTEFGVDVSYDTYTSNEELVEGLKVGKKSYDVVFPSDNEIPEMIKQHLLAPLDRSQIPNFENIDHRFVGLPYDTKNQYCVPYNWGTTGVAVNTDKVRQEVKGWDALWDPALQGKISVLNEARAGFLPALKRLGFSVNTTDPAELDKAKQLLLQQKPLLKAYSSDKYLDFLRTGKVWIAVGYSGDVIRLTAERPNIRYIIPQEGTDLWVDNICIPKGAEHPEAAHKFINYLLRPEVAAAITNETGFATANEAARKFIRPEVLSNPNVFPPDEILAKTEYAKSLGDAEDVYEDLWDQVLKAPIQRGQGSDSSASTDDD